MAQEFGYIKQIFPVESFNGRDGKQYQKRLVWIDNTYVDRLGQRGAESTIEFEFTGDRINDLNGFAVGQPVKVSYSLRGTTAQSKTSGKMMCFVKLHGFKIEHYGNQQPIQQAQVQQYQAPQQSIQQPQYQQPQYQQNQVPLQPQGTVNLPF